MVGSLVVEGLGETGGGLVAVVRRLAVDQAFVTEVREHPLDALAQYDLSGPELAALSLLLEGGGAGVGLDAVFQVGA